MKLATLIVCAMFGAAGSAQAANVIYSNDFSSGTQGFTLGASDVGTTTSPSGEIFLELPDYQSNATLTLDTSAYVGGSVTVDFTLDVVGSMDGSGPTLQGGGAGDFFTVASGGSTLFDYSFANYDGGNTQSYPTPLSAPGTGASGIDTLGYSGFPNSGNNIQDSIYNTLAVTVSPTSASTSFTFTSFANEGASNEFYGIDNVVATATAVSAAPEPGAWALMLAGVGMMGAMLRTARGRRREDDVLPLAMA